MNERLNTTELSATAVHEAYAEKARQQQQQQRRARTIDEQMKGDVQKSLELADNPLTPMQALYRSVDASPAEKRLIEAFVVTVASSILGQAGHANNPLQVGVKGLIAQHRAIVAEAVIRTRVELAGLISVKPPLYPAIPPSMMWNAETNQMESKPAVPIPVHFMCDDAGGDAPIEH